MIKGYKGPYGIIPFPYRTAAAQTLNEVDGEQIAEATEGGTHDCIVALKSGRYAIVRWQENGRGKTDSRGIIQRVAEDLIVGVVFYTRDEMLNYFAQIVEKDPGDFTLLMAKIAARPIVEDSAE